MFKTSVSIYNRSCLFIDIGGSRKRVWGHMVSADHEHLMGSGGKAPSWAQGHSPPASRGQFWS